MMSKRLLLDTADAYGYVTWGQAKRFAEGHDWYDDFVETFKSCSWGDKVYYEDLLEWVES